MQAADLKKLREKFDLSIDEAADLIGVHFSTWWRWENGQGEISEANLHYFKAKVASKP